MDAAGAGMAEALAAQLGAQVGAPWAGSWPHRRIYVNIPHSHQNKDHW